MNVEDELHILADEDGQPWAAFVVGHAEPAEVAARITLDAIEDATGFDEVEDFCKWPPKVRHFFIRRAEDGEFDAGDFDNVWVKCDKRHPNAQIVTGHWF